MGENVNEKIVWVLGIKLDNYLLEDAMDYFSEFLENDVLNTIGVVSTSLLMAASEDEELIQQIDSLDMTIIGEKEILEAAQIEHKRRHKEVENHQFFNAFFKYSSEYHKSIFLLVDRESQIEKLNTYLEGKYNGINIVGAYAVENSNEDGDTIVNEVNSISPDIIVSVIGTTFQEKFIYNNKQKLNAKVWLGLGHHERARNSIGLKPSWLSKLVDKTLFKRMVSKYNSEIGE